MDKGRFVKESEGMDYEFSTTNTEKISLHDCRVSFAELNGGRLTLYFADGFMHADISDDWPNTGDAKIEFQLSSESEACLYLFEMDDMTIRKKYTIQHVVEKIGTKEWELEFAYADEGAKQFVHTCWIWTQKQGTFYAELSIGTKEAPVFYWNAPHAQFTEVQTDGQAF